MALNYFSQLIIDLKMSWIIYDLMAIGNFKLMVKATTVETFRI